MTERNTLARALHDIGLAGWFGGSLMGAVGVNAAAGTVDESGQRARVANAGWARWTPVNAGLIAAHLFGAGRLTWANKGRFTTQKGVAGATIAKGALTMAALGATAYARVVGQRVIAAGDVPVESGAEPTSQTPSDVAQAQRQLKALQWVVPGLTGGVLVLNALMGEQQRPKQVFGGIVQRLAPPAALAGAAGSATTFLASRRGKQRSRRRR